MMLLVRSSGRHSALDGERVTIQAAVVSWFGAASSGSYRSAHLLG